MSATGHGRKRSRDDGPFDFDGQYGQSYEALAHTVIPGYETAFEQVLAILRGRLGTAARILVVGAGTGIEIVKFGARQPGWRFTGVDPSRQMLDLARQRIEEAGLADVVRLVHGFTGDVETGEFDAVTCFNVMHFLEDEPRGGSAKQALLSQMAARLRAGGSLVLFDLHGDPTGGVDAEMFRAWADLWALRGMDPDGAGRFRQRISEGIHWAPEERIREMLAAAGYRRVHLFFRSLLYGAWIGEKGGAAT